MNPVIWIEPESCILCYACVRECPAMAVEVRANVDHVNILSERCIACGSCFTVCPTRAVRMASDLDRITGALASGRTARAIIDPAISAEFPDITDYRNFVGMIRALGFAGVYDLSFAVDLSARMHATIFAGFKGKYRIASKCPAVTAYIEKHQPALTENLVPVPGPASIMASIIRENNRPDDFIVLITPCLATRLEKGIPGDSQEINAQLSFPDLREWFGQRSITENSVEFSDFDPPHGQKGALFPLPSGFMQAAGEFENLLSSNFVTASGHEDMVESLREFSSTYDIKRHLDLFCCDGCLMGPGMSPSGLKFGRRTLVTDYAAKRLDTVDPKSWEAWVKKHEQSIPERKFHPNPGPMAMPDETEIQDILRLIGVSGDHDIHRGCKACGYESCREFATAVALGFAKAEMCHLYGTRNRQEYIKSLRSSNEQLAKAQKALQDSEQKAREEKQLALEYSETLTAVLQKIPSGVVVVNEKYRILEANREFIEILGDDLKSVDEVIPGLKGADLKTIFPPFVMNLFSFVLQSGRESVSKDVQLANRLLNISVFPVRQGAILGAVLRDLSLPEVQKEEVIKRVNEVIDKNLEMVQKIGFLLGEGASDTEKMLNSIISYYRSEENR